MEKIGLISDTHGNEKLMRDAMLTLVYREEVRRIWHLGDSYTDAGLLASEAGVPVTAVPGIYCPEYKDGSAPRKRRELVEEIDFTLVHVLEELTEEDKALTNIILFGHSHRREAFTAGGRLYINPGHLKAEEDRRNPASFALLEVDRYRLTCAVFDVEGSPVARANYLLETGFFK
jgi:putative phosphoesterase